MDDQIKDDKPVGTKTTISKHKLTLRDLAIIVGSSLASNPEIGEYEIAFALDPETGDMDCVAVSSDGKKGWKIFTNSMPDIDFPVVVKEKKNGGFIGKLKNLLRGKNNDGNGNC